MSTDSADRADGADPADPADPADSAGKAAAIAAVQEQVDVAPFHRLVRMIVTDVDHDAGRLVLRLPYDDTLQRAAGTRQIHGGPIASVIDTAGTFAVAAMVGHGVPTVNLRIDYLRPAVETDLVATAVVRRAGRTMAVCDIDLHDGEGRLVAVGRGTWSTTAG